MQKVALITGISGQDGSYLAAHLLNLGYSVHGTTRSDEQRFWRHNTLGISDQVTIHVVDLTQKDEVALLIKSIQPNEIYHLAANSSVAATFTKPTSTIAEATLISTNLLDSVAAFIPEGRFFHASSAEIFAPNDLERLTTTHPINPITPYGAGKAIAHALTKQYRQHGQIYAVNGILFQHESPLRDERSFIKKTIKQALAIKDGSEESIVVGNIENKRDFGSAEEYVIGIWQSLQADTPEDYIIATGEAKSIKDILYFIVDNIGISRDYIVSDLSKFPPHPAQIIGDPRATASKLNWAASDTIFDTILKMISFETNQKNHGKN